ncbi:ABC transporter permease [Acetobacter sp. AN02]|uniref:ABC transporter permease n=1 Tax=Acetobacter sp. AN02 TaxID=2894186 RepID=UPI0024345D41|nr:ABC transporter permease [Acetobacter sp. AN02]MDG6094628.1 ABC transporter permease [Acetobacter sp. AN02]
MNTTPQTQTALARSVTAEEEPSLDLYPGRGLAKLHLAWKDITEGARLYRLSYALGWLDIRLRYRGSMLGPFWLTLTTAITVAAMGTLYGTLFHTNLRVYLPFLSFSLILWAWLNMVVSDGCSVFSNAHGMIHSMRMPLSVHVSRICVRALLTFLHSVPVIAVLFLIFGITPRLTWEIPASLIVFITDTFAIGLLCGVLGARFRDVSPVMASIMQILFFITPILWRPELIYLGRQYMLLDPAYPLIEIVRAPIMNDHIRPSIWLAALFYSAMLWGLAVILFARVRARISYWV